MNAAGKGPLEGLSENVVNFPCQSSEVGGESQSQEK